MSSEHRFSFTKSDLDTYLKALAKVYPETGIIKKEPCHCDN